MMQWANKKQGFTIVELLIVIVVIAILATVTIVAFSGIQNRAKQSALQSNLSQQAKRLAVWKLQNNDTYPASLAAAQTEGMLVNTSDVEYVNYIPATNLMSYCVTAQRTDGTRFSISSGSGAPVSGECAKNLLTNTSVELNTANLQNIGSTGDRTIVRLAAGDAYSGGYVLRLTVGASGGVAGYGSTSPTLGLGRYTGSLWIRSNAAINLSPYYEGSATRTTVVQSNSVILTPGVWTRVWRTFDITVAGTVKVGFLAGGAGTTAPGNYVELDGFSLTAGDRLYDFRDGATAGWFWDGAEHAAQSVGPAVVTP
jgi:prepilin-type N-terminal cleavage/methylation domain-containing protein